MSDFPEGVALVAGGSGGVGAAVCVRLAAAGADVAVTFRRNRAAAETAAGGVAAAGRRGEVFPIDLGDAAACEALAAEVEARLGRIHTVVHAVGADIPMRFLSDVTPATWAETVTAEVNGFYHLVRATLPYLRRGDGSGSSIVAVTSAGLRRYPPRDILSVAPKAAIEAMVRGLASEEGRFGVRANAVALGVIETGIFERLRDGGGIDERWLEVARKRTPLGRFGRAEEVAEAVVYLASARAAYVTGQSLAVDGGYSL